MDGFYAVSMIYFPYLDVEQQDLRFWANSYKTRFGEDPGTCSTGGYATIDMVIRAKQKAGSNLTADSFNKAIAGMGEIPADICSATRRCASATSSAWARRSRA